MKSLSDYDVQTDIVLPYTSNPALTIQDMAKTLELSPVVISTVLALNNVKIRKGNPNPEALKAASEKGRAVRSAKALQRQLSTLVEKHGIVTISDLLEEMKNTTN